MTRIFDAPKVEQMGQRRFAGPVRHYTMQTRAEIPTQWMDYNASDLRVLGAEVQDFYGLVWNHDAASGTFDYMCGQEVPLTASVPESFGAVTIEGAYARFATGGHISTIQAAWAEIYGVWLAEGLQARSGPSVEHYPPSFNGETGDGGFELWVPVLA